MFEKKVTTELIEQYLEKLGLPHHAIDEPGEEQGIVVTMLPTSPTKQYALLIDPIVEQSRLRFRVNGVVTAPLDATPADRLSGLLLALLTYNYRIPLGGFAFDPLDGEVMLKYDLPIHGKPLPFEDFKDVVGTLGGVLLAHAADLVAIVDGTKRPEDLIGPGGGTAAPPPSTGPMI
jgi:hypothetical protein